MQVKKRKIREGEIKGYGRGLVMRCRRLSMCLKRTHDANGRATEKTFPYTPEQNSRRIYGRGNQENLNGFHSKKEIPKVRKNLHLFTCLSLSLFLYQNILSLTISLFLRLFEHQSRKEEKEYRKESLRGGGVEELIAHSTTQAKHHFY